MISYNLRIERLGMETGSDCLLIIDSFDYLSGHSLGQIKCQHRLVSKCLCTLKYWHNRNENIPGNDFAGIILLHDSSKKPFADYSYITVMHKLNIEMAAPLITFNIQHLFGSVLAFVTYTVI